MPLVRQPLPNLSPEDRAILQSIGTNPLLNVPPWLATPPWAPAARLMGFPRVAEVGESIGKEAAGALSSLTSPRGLATAGGMALLPEVVGPMVSASSIPGTGEGWKRSWEAMKMRDAPGFAGGLATAGIGLAGLGLGALGLRGRSTMSEVRPVERFSGYTPSQLQEALTIRRQFEQFEKTQAPPANTIAFRMKDGSIIKDKDARAHYQLVDKYGLNPDDIESRGFIDAATGKYLSDTVAPSGPDTTFATALLEKLANEPR